MTCATVRGHGGGDYMGRSPPRGVSGLSHILGTANCSPGSLTPGERQTLWLAGGLVGLTGWLVGSLDSALEEQGHTCLLPEAWQR